MNSNTPTPETDAEVLRCEDKYYRLYPDSKNKPVDDDFARKLERERDSLREERDKVRLAYGQLQESDNLLYKRMKESESERDQLIKVCDMQNKIIKGQFSTQKEADEMFKLYRQLPHLNK